jgi:putative ATP-dependent endonuclease of the OLD family
MRLHSLKVQGFRKLKSETILFGDATFLIGPNNAGKSSVLRAIEYLLSSQKQIPSQEWYSEVDSDTGEQKVVAEEICLEAEFRNLPDDAHTWRGFKGRIFSYEKLDEEDTGNAIFYRKTYRPSKDASIEMKSLVRTIKVEFSTCKSPIELVDAGADIEEIKSIFGSKMNEKMSPKDREMLRAINDLWDVGDDETWDENPGGIPGVVLSRLPSFLLIPAETAADEISKNSGVLQKTLSELFVSVRDTSKNYQIAQASLDALAKELDPTDTTSEFGKMMKGLNEVLASVFPDSTIHAVADLSDPNTALKPSFTVSMASNVRTDVGLQGTGMVRSAVFGLLRYRQKWLAERDHNGERSVIIGFEEPEIYLHPSAANQMRNTIYELSNGSSQIIATTHSPFMIDLSRKPRQILNKFSSGATEGSCIAFNVSEKFKALQDNDKYHVKMLAKIDDYVARVFFTKTVLIVEGDTEEVVIREALHRLGNQNKAVYLKILSDFEIIKARGKAAIISLAKYLKSLGVEIFVIHDRDQGVAGAEVMNDPIRLAVDDDDKLIVLEECMEDVLGYDPPATEKPYRAYKHTTGWGENWDDVPDALKAILSKAFGGYIPEGAA